MSLKTVGFLPLVGLISLVAICFIRPTHSWKPETRPKKTTIGLLHPWKVSTTKECRAKLRLQGEPSHRDPLTDGIFCNATYDTVLCWPTTPGNSKISLPCPPMKGSDPKKNVVKECLGSGMWERANYTTCIDDRTIKLFDEMDWDKIRKHLDNQKRIRNR